MSLLSPQLIWRLNRLTFLARRPMSGILTGHHKSSRRGTSLDFAQLRQYSFGDDWRYLDWKIYARQDKFFVREYEEETNLIAYLIVDASRSLALNNKLDHCRKLAAALAYILNKQKDAVGLIVFAESIEKFLPARRGVKHLALIWQYLEETTPAGATDWNKIFSEIIGGLIPRKPGLVFLFSDLLGPDEKIIPALKYLAARHNEVVVFQILSPSELAWDNPGLVQIRDAETRQTLYLESDIRYSYQKVIGKLLNEYRQQLSASGIDYQLAPTNQPIEKILSDFWQKR
jgi:uncharacterized protein (DUF58 family)